MAVILIPQFLDMSHRRLTTKRKARFAMYDVPSDDDDPIPAEPIRNTTYAADASGVFSHSTHFISTTNPATRRRPLPPTIAHPPLTNFDTVELPDMSYFSSLSADYIEKLAEMDDGRRRRGAGDDPLGEWSQNIDLWLSEMIRLEGRGDYHDDTCRHCGIERAAYQCASCLDLGLLCRGCMVSRHQTQPLHWISLWTGIYFERVTLKRLGLRIQLGHPVGCECPRPASAFDNDFVIIHTNGIHRVGLDFCGCASAPSHSVQLLRSRLFPATSVNPRTAATFQVLRTFHLLSLQSKLSGWEYYRSLARQTDNTGLWLTKDRYPAFMRMMREWRHLKMLKRAGRANDEHGVKATATGSCAVICPACPYPGRNLPQGWENAPPSKHWQYRLFLGIDANFRLKRKDVSSDAKDPGLNHGYAYFVEQSKYMQHLSTYGDLPMEEASTCSDHDAIKLAQLKGTAAKNTATTGVGTVECSRHDMKRPGSVGDLQKGERYVNMDYLFASSLEHHGTLDVVASYDITCQWTRRLSERMSKYDCKLQFDGQDIQFLFLIPKFHLPAHQDSCQTGFSFNLTAKVGRSDGEAPERGWAWVDPLAMSTREMGPGSRRDVLDDAFGDYNWQKISRMAATLLRKIKEAVLERNDHMDEFEDLKSALPHEHVTKWLQAIEAWEADPTNKNPFVATQKNVTLASVRLQLAGEEAAVTANGCPAPSLHTEISPHRLITAGLELEELQCRVALDVSSLSAHATDLQRAKLLERQTALARKIEAWMSIQYLYMPFVVMLRHQNGVPEVTDTPAQSMKLYLPSELPPQIPCNVSLLQYEWRLRFAQAYELLDDLRRHLRLCTHLRSLKNRFARGVRHKTRARTVIDNTQQSINTDSKHYRATRTALVILASRLRDKEGWDVHLQPLLDSDVRELQEGTEAAVSEGRRTLSWIWRVPGVGGPDDSAGLQEALRIEFCRTRARANRWAEECVLLQEEMRRVIAYHAWQSKWWKERENSWVRCDGQRVSDEASYAEGAKAYACRQSALRENLSDHCTQSWQYVSVWVGDSDSSDAASAM